MDSLELNKAAAAVLLAGIAFVGSGLIGHALVHPEIPAEPAYRDRDAADRPGRADQRGAGAADANLLASADPAVGEAQTKAQGCVACHTFNEGGKAGVGPEPLRRGRRAARAHAGLRLLERAEVQAGAVDL